MRDLIAIGASVCIAVAGAAFGAPPVVVVVPHAPTPVERFAAAELAGELGKCLGIHLDVVVEGSQRGRPALYVGATRAAKATHGGRRWRADEVFLKSVPDGVVLDGDPARAPIYAVDIYLEVFCGVRWWTSEAATHPALGEVPLRNVEYVHAPQFKYRETYYLDGLDPLFKVRSKGNFTSLTRYMLSDIKFIPPEMGGNHRLYFFKGRRSAYHSFFEILPPSIHFAKHPEWYSLVKNRRQAKQLCLANGEMRAEYIRETLRRLREDPFADFVQVSQNDWDGYCTCAECRAMMDEDGGVASGPYLRFANAVAEAVEREFPNVRIDTFAYQFTRKAPKKTRPRHNVVVRLCDIECDFARPLADGSSPKNAAFAKDLAEWRRVAGGNLFIWDYMANFASYMMPHPNISSIAPNIRLFAENGAVGVFEQGDVLCSAGTFAAFRHYLASHLLWNPADDEKRLTGEFFAGYYGKAAAPLLEKLVELVDAGPVRHGMPVGCHHAGAPFLSAEEKLEVMRLMDSAVSAAEREGEMYAARVRRERLSIDHLMLQNYDVLRDLACKKGVPWKRPSERADAVDAWIREVKAHGVRAVRETKDAADIGRHFDRLRRN